MIFVLVSFKQILKILVNVFLEILNQTYYGGNNYHRGGNWFINHGQLDMLNMNVY